MTKDFKQDGKNLDSPKITAFPPIAEIKERAANWLVRIDSGDFSVADQQALAEWVAADTLHQDTLFKLAKQWDSMTVLSGLSELFPLVNKEPVKDSDQASGWFGNIFSGGFRGIGQSLQAFLLSRLSQTAIAASVVFLIAVLTIPSFQDTLLGIGAPKYVTAVGERSTFTLSDGSIVTLNTNSKLTVHYSDKRREVRLNRGEANFEVVKNTRQPFVVRAGDGLVWAVGTTFNVRYTHPAGDTDKTAVNVMVTEGTVKVFTDIAKVSQAKLTVDPKELQQEQLAVVNTQSTGKNTQPEKPSLKNQRQSLLTAGQSIRFTEVINDKEVLPQAQIEKQLAWHNGVIIFDGETLEQALLEVSRYTDKELRIVDPAIRNIPVGGHYKTNNIDALLASLSDGFGIAVKSVGDNRVHLSAK